MSPVSRFQSGWPGRLPRGARPLTFYLPERLFALSLGWRPVVAVEDPAIAPLFARGGEGAALEEALRARGITHVYFESRIPVPEKFPIQPQAFVEHLRRRAPLWRAEGFEMYALGGAGAAGRD